VRRGDIVRFAVVKSKRSGCLSAVGVSVTAAAPLDVLRPGWVRGVVVEGAVGVAPAAAAADGAAAPQPRDGVVVTTSGADGARALGALNFAASYVRRTDAPLCIGDAVALRVRESGDARCAVQLVLLERAQRSCGIVTSIQATKDFGFLRIKKVRLGFVASRCRGAPAARESITTQARRSARTTHPLPSSSPARTSAPSPSPPHTSPRATVPLRYPPRAVPPPRTASTASP
jgi:hypothetical protein